MTFEEMTTTLRITLLIVLVLPPLPLTIAKSDLIKVFFFFFANSAVFKINNSVIKNNSGYIGGGS
jgi:hypothetical protein